MAVKVKVYKRVQGDTHSYIVQFANVKKTTEKMGDADYKYVEVNKNKKSLEWIAAPLIAQTADAMISFDDPQVVEEESVSEEGVVKESLDIQTLQSPEKIALDYVTAYEEKEAKEKEKSERRNMSVKMKVYKIQDDQYFVEFLDADDKKDPEKTKAIQLKKNALTQEWEAETITLTKLISSTYNIGSYIEETVDLDDRGDTADQLKNAKQIALNSVTEHEKKEAKEKEVDDAEAEEEEESEEKFTYVLLRDIPKNLTASSSLSVFGPPIYYLKEVSQNNKPVFFKINVDNEKKITVDRMSVPIKEKLDVTEQLRLYREERELTVDADVGIGSIQMANAIQQAINEFESEAKLGRDKVANEKADKNQSDVAPVGEVDELSRMAAKFRKEEKDKALSGAPPSASAAPAPSVPPSSGAAAPSSSSSSTASVAGSSGTIYSSGTVLSQPPVGSSSSSAVPQPSGGASSGVATSQNPSTTFTLFKSELGGNTRYFLEFEAIENKKRVPYRYEVVKSKGGGYELLRKNNGTVDDPWQKLPDKLIASLELIETQYPLTITQDAEIFKNPETMNNYWHRILKSAVKGAIKSKRLLESEEDEGEEENSLQNNSESARRAIATEIKLVRGTLKSDSKKTPHYYLRTQRSSGGKTTYYELAQDKDGKYQLGLTPNKKELNAFDGVGVDFDRTSIREGTIQGHDLTDKKEMSEWYTNPQMPWSPWVTKQIQESTGEGRMQESERADEEAPFFTIGVGKLPKSSAEAALERYLHSTSMAAKQQRIDSVYFVQVPKPGENGRFEEYLIVKTYSIYKSHSMVTYDFRIDENHNPKLGEWVQENLVNNELVRKSMLVKRVNITSTLPYSDIDWADTICRHEGNEKRLNAYLNSKGQSPITLNAVAKAGDVIKSTPQQNDRAGINIGGDAARANPPQQRIAFVRDVVSRFVLAERHRFHVAGSTITVTSDHTAADKSTATYTDGTNVLRRLDFQPAANGGIDISIQQKNSYDQEDYEALISATLQTFRKMKMNNRDLQVDTLQLTFNVAPGTEDAARAAIDVFRRKNETDQPVNREEINALLTRLDQSIGLAQQADDQDQEAKKRQRGDVPHNQKKSHRNGYTEYRSKPKPFRRKSVNAADEQDAQQVTLSSRGEGEVEVNSEEKETRKSHSYNPRRNGRS